MDLTVWTVQAVNPGSVTNLAQWSGLDVSQLVRGPDTCRFTMPGDLLQTGVIVEKATDLLVWRGGVKMFTGRVLTADRQLGDEFRVPVAAVDYRGLLSYRMLHTPLTFTNDPQATIVRDLIDHSQALPSGDLGITAGTLDSGGQNRDRTYEAGAWIGQLIDNMSKVDNGFDWWIDHDRALQVRTPRLAASTSKVLTYQGNIRLMDVKQSDFANVVRFSGAPDQTTPVIVPATLSDTRGRWEWSGQSASTILQTTVQEHADGELAARVDPMEVYVMQVAPGAWDQLLLTKGDLIRVRAQRGAVTIDSMARVTELRFTVDGGGRETVTVVAEQEP